ncbi:ABC transporter substrate-binding protein [Aquipseudomonas alcaligenes]|uniref:Iron complex transport system substrate-binding protein n=1 Tax=Aquipseudomonas alcaligenes TaxID=43263 RepID=A0A1N6T561_AQUAC|nr:ABC transporter substrate-binding protein [Pseudomonas alcaligenes]SIQ48367.1 iron complex transport system substrate-binding protein [Pseudomonas alcaligenes]
MRGLLCVLALLAGLAQADVYQPRIAVIDWGLTETLLGLGVTPIAVAQTEGYRRWVQAPELPTSVVDLGLRVEPNLELLSQLKPDMILITPQFAASRPQLERIAPVHMLAIYTPEAEAYAGAQRVTRELAELLDRKAQGEALITRVDARMAQVRQRLAMQALPPFYVLTFLDERHVRLFGKQSIYQGVFDRVGLRNAWNGPTNYWGFSQQGIERLAEEPGAALLYLEPMPPGTAEGLAASALWQQLPAVRGQRLYGLPPVWSFNGLMAAERFANLLEARLAPEIAP